MLIGQTVVHRLSIPAGGDELAHLQNLQLMRNRGLVHLEVITDLRDVLLTLEKIVKDLDPGGIPENLEKLCQIAELILGNILNEMRYFLCVVCVRHGFLRFVHALR